MFIMDVYCPLSPYVLMYVCEGTIRGGDARPCCYFYHVNGISFYFQSFDIFDRFPCRSRRYGHYYVMLMYL